MAGNGKIDSIKTTGIEPLVPYADRATTTRSTTASQVPLVARDGVDARRPDVTGGPTAADRHRADQNNTAAPQPRRDVQRTIAEADAAKKPDYGRAILEFFTTFGRALPLIGRLISLVAAAFRVLRVAFMFATGKGDRIDAKKELIGLGLDVIGIFIPIAGALGSAAKNYWFNESEILGGMNLLVDDTEKDSAIRQTADGVKETAVGVYEAAKRIFTGGDSVRPAEGQVPFLPLTPVEVPVG